MQNNVYQNAWNKSIEYLDYDADIVFFGDSITIRTDWQSAFPEYEIYNFGCYGDNLTRLKNRVFAIQYLKPEKIFILGGVNTLSSGYPIDKSLEIYREILDELSLENNNAEIFVQSILPVQNNQNLNDRITKMNTLLKAIADEYDFEFIDLYPLFENNGEMRADYTVDGIHLSDAGKDVWINALHEYIIR